ncbi:hypothetical protein HDU97_003836 [Phlyctochytrium planicorne]|nr:hypothetical protein HDU97_003836 [Phlyctochytrium planicorne]
MEGEDLLFFVDRTGDSSLLEQQSQEQQNESKAVEINQEEFIPLASGSGGCQRRNRNRFGRAPGGQAQQPRSKRKKGPRKQKEPRYGFSDDSFIRPTVSDDERDEDELAAFIDYLENASDGDMASVSALAHLSINNGDPVDSDSDAEEEELAEAGVFDKLMEMDDMDAEHRFVGSSDDEDDDDLNQQDVEDEEEVTGGELFSGGRSTWEKDPAALANEAKFQSILNGFSPKAKPKQHRFQKRSKPTKGTFSQHGGINFTKSTGAEIADDSLSDSLDNEEEDKEEVEEESTSKAALRKARRSERKSERSIKREKRKELEAEQERISKTIGKFRAGDVIDKNIMRLLDQINRMLRDFAEGDSEEPLESAPLPPMASALRRLVAEMCKHYRILPKTQGSGTRKTLYIIRTGSTHVPENWGKVVEQVVNRGNNAIIQGNTKLGPRTPRKSTKPPGAPDDRAAPRPGHVVGENASPLSTDNVGYRMLLALGYQPGESLGSTQSDAAITAPIEVTIRHKRRGLGAE